jgi:hypothetical protein
VIPGEAANKPPLLRFSGEIVAEAFHAGVAEMTLNEIS